MGLGGYLMWTAVAREICNNLGPNSQVLPIETHGNFIKLVKSDMFSNNSKIIQNFEQQKAVAFPMVLNNPNANYCKADTPERAVHRYDKHVIEQICEVYGITNVTLKCELFLTQDEESIGLNCKSQRGRYIVIEPQTKDEYGVNKTYSFDKWQMIVNELSKSGVRIVQIGKKTKDKLLSGVIDMTGTTSFREAAGIIKHADLFVSAEGGLMHAANAVGTKSVIIYSGFIHPNMTAYPENVNLWIGKSHGPCGMKVKCDLCQNEMLNHDHGEVVNATKKILGIS